MPRIAFLDFEASSLEKNGYPIEVGWVFANGEAEDFLIRPAPGWTDWSPDAERVHGIPRERLLAEGRAHDWVALHMMTRLRTVRLYASAPSWDGKWLSRLLRSAGLPRHALRLQDTDAARCAAVLDILAQSGLPPALRGGLANRILADAKREARTEAAPAHRALADAERELARWERVRTLAREAAERYWEDTTGDVPSPAIP